MKNQADALPEDAPEDGRISEPGPSAVDEGPSPEVESSERDAERGDASRDADARPRRAPIERALRALFGLTIAACIGVIALKVIAHFDVRTLWDDAYIFQRYAHNVLHDGRIAWNPGGAPTYGLTSLAFLVVNVPLLVATRGNMSLAAILSSLLPGVALIVLLAWLAKEAAGRRMAGVAIGLVFVCLARSTFADHFVSGMDTTFGLCFGATYLIVAHRLSTAPSKRLVWALGVLGGMSFLIRPELATMAVLVPLSFVVFSRSPEERRGGVVALGVTLLLLAVHLAACRLYFGTALPLPFWVKGTEHYGAGFARAYRGDNTKLLIPWLGSFWPLFVPTAVEVLSSPRAFLKKAPAIDKALVVAVIFLLGYTWLVMTQIMAQAQRFYYPLVPLLIYLASSSLTRLWALAPRQAAPSHTGALVAAGALVFALWDVAPSFTTAGKDLLGAALGGSIGRFDMQKHVLEQGPQGYWFKLDRFAALPDDTVIATTEVGLLGALNSTKTVVDLAGLNEPRFAHSRFSAETLFTVWKPDIIYMPHPDYEEMTEGIQRHPALADYDVYTKGQIQTSSFGVAIRKSSKYHAQMDAIVKERRRPGDGKR
ncbi:hypothetical protein [Polyangium sp. 15x6]|uniref:hypothetical protein n=1 Tax=Polyangium sp. 15x6 TaxID=3042687 RepID=UPI00249B6A2C|nr:hypothetical protein [Polyangium sp. 15x6]MDI3282679.1 hypothetical protein [Polyangium sp. 15x6]